jgi:hypothetical protein
LLQPSPSRHVLHTQQPRHMRLIIDCACIARQGCVMHIPLVIVRARGPPRVRPLWRLPSTIDRIMAAHGDPDALLCAMGCNQADVDKNVMAGSGVSAAAAAVAVATASELDRS